jgi:hypothetical protein
VCGCLQDVQDAICHHLDDCVMAETAAAGPPERDEMDMATVDPEGPDDVRAMLGAGACFILPQAAGGLRESKCAALTCCTPSAAAVTESVRRRQRLQQRWHLLSGQDSPVQSAHYHA